jgi:hypothetical protein
MGETMKKAHNKPQQQDMELVVVSDKIYEELYERLRNGEKRLSDKELDLLYDHVYAAGMMLSKLGPVFRLARNELFDVADKIRRQQEARRFMR